MSYSGRMKPGTGRRLPFRVAVAIAAAFLAPAATLTFSAVSHSSVVDQYTEEIPTPGGGTPAPPPAKPDPPAAPKPQTNGQSEPVVSPPVVGSVVVETEPEPTVRKTRERERPREERDRRDVAGSENSIRPITSLQSSGAPGGMGTLFPALILLALAASTGYLLGSRRQGARSSGKGGRS